MAYDIPLAEFRWFSIVCRIKSSCGLHALVSACVSPPHATSCFLLSASKLSGCFSFSKHNIPLGQDPPRTSLLIRVFHVSFILDFPAILQIPCQGHFH